MRLVILVTLYITYVHSYHILCVFPVPSRSHNTLGKGIVDSLLKAGHEVTWATPYPPKAAKKGLNIIDVSVTIPIIEGIDMTKNAKLGMAGLSLVKSYSRNISLAALTPHMRETLVNTQFDAVVTEMFFSEVDSGYAAIQGVPWILLSGIVLQPNLESLVDAANSVPIIPMMFTDYAVPMDFFQRMVTAGIYAGMKINNWLDKVNPAVFDSMWAPLAKARGVPLSSYDEAVHNISVLLVNSHPSFSGARSLPPNVVEVAGYHIDEDIPPLPKVRGVPLPSCDEAVHNISVLLVNSHPSFSGARSLPPVQVAGYHIDEDIPPLPKDLQDLLDASPQGVVYFSMGSVLKSASFPQQTRSELLQVFAALPYTVLWKFEEKIDGLPKNVHIRDWMPQASILAHPNVKIFITHGGILSNLEAVYHGVPLIALPLYGDQPANANRAVREGYAVKLEYNFDTMAAQVGEAVDKVMGDDSYHKRAKHVSFLFKNRPVKPAQLVADYVELAIASKGAYHLRSKALHYPWWQRNMIDIAAFIVAILATLYFIAKKITKFILSLFFKKQKPSNDAKAKKKAKKTN